jgi:hypothetical protein
VLVVAHQQIDFKSSSDVRASVARIAATPAVDAEAGEALLVLRAAAATEGVAAYIELMKTGVRRPVQDIKLSLRNRARVTGVCVGALALSRPSVAS